ncbi:MAG: Rpn family recombination-promoting nuclease/putative transposase [Ruminococcus sp.]
MKKEVYVISLIEHKSDIDYDVAMQLLRYMTVIWQDYKRCRIRRWQTAVSERTFGIR